MSTALIMVLAIILIVCVTAYVFRFLAHKWETESLRKEGVVITDNGLEVPGALILNKRLIPYEDVKAVELLSPVASFLYLFRVSVASVCTRAFADVIAIELKSPPQFKKYLLATPRNAPVFVEQLRRRIQQAKTKSP